MIAIIKCVKMQKKEYDKFHTQQRNIYKPTVKATYRNYKNHKTHTHIYTLLYKKSGQLTIADRCALILNCGNNMIWLKRHKVFCKAVSCDKW